MSGDKLRDLLIKHEGVRLKPYRCTQGRLTIGVGRNLESEGVSELEAMLMLANDLARVRAFAGQLNWFNSLSSTRQDVVLSMIFNLGPAGFLEFKGMIDAVVRGDFERAADEMRDSKWFGQVGLRGLELERMMRLDSYSGSLA